MPIRPHPLAADLLAPRVMKSEAGLVLAERVIGMLREAGFSPSQASQTASFLLCSIVTLVTSEPGKQTPLSADDLAEADRQQARRSWAPSIPSCFPTCWSRPSSSCSATTRMSYFARGMDFLVDGTRGVRPA